MNEDKIRELHERMEGQDKKLDVQGEKIDKILSLLQDDEFGRPGMNTRLTLIEKKQGLTEQQVNRIKWTAGVIATIVSVIAGAISISL